MFSMAKPIEIVFSEKKTPSLNSPYLICGFPGTGLVGKLAVDYLIKELGAIHMADLFSSYFSPQVVIQADRTTSKVKNSLYYVKNNNNNINKTSKKHSKEFKDINNVQEVPLNQSINGPPQSNESLKPTTSDTLSSNDLILLTG